MRVLDRPPLHVKFGEERIYAYRHYREQPPQHPFTEQLRSVAVERHTRSVIHAMFRIPRDFPALGKRTYYEQRAEFKQETSQTQKRSHKQISVKRSAHLGITARYMSVFCNPLIHSEFREYRIYSERDYCQKKYKRALAEQLQTVSVK